MTVKITVTEAKNKQKCVNEKRFSGTCPTSESSRKMRTVEITPTGNSGVTVNFAKSVSNQ